MADGWMALTADWYPEW